MHLGSWKRYGRGGLNYKEYARELEEQFIGKSIYDIEKVLGNISVSNYIFRMKNKEFIELIKD